MPRELTGQIKPHTAKGDDGSRGKGPRGLGSNVGGETAGEESERISWPTQKPTLLMTLSAVISGCYLSWLPGAHLLRITNLYTPLLCVSPSRVSFAHLFLPSSLLPSPSAHPYPSRSSPGSHQDHGIPGISFRPRRDVMYIFNVWINKKVYMRA